MRFKKKGVLQLILDESLLVNKPQGTPRKHRTIEEVSPYESTRKSINDARIMEVASVSCKPCAQKMLKGL
ncbi:unnamed protein product [Prunus armeniaca]